MSKAEAVFFDVRDTLGVVDRQGHLIPYRPTSEQLLRAMRSVVRLRIGLITNLPDNVSTDDGKKMVSDAGLWDYLDEKGFVTNHEAGYEKPRVEIYEYAARQMGVPVERCLFVGENLIEVIAAEAAGMRGVLKPFPPGREFLFKPVKPGVPTETSSGRLSELIMEEDHLVGKRIVSCGMKIRDRLQALQNPQVSSLEGLPLRAMGMLVWLTKHFVDTYHHRKEEEVLIPFALMRGFSQEECAFVTVEHEQGRNYFDGMDIALRRCRSGDVKALVDFQYCINGFIDLYREHGRKEDDVLFKRLGEQLTEQDDSLIVELMGRIGPTDITLYLAVIAEMEAQLTT